MDEQLYSIQNYNMQSLIHTLNFLSGHILHIWVYEADSNKRSRYLVMVLLGVHFTLRSKRNVIPVPHGSLARYVKSRVAHAPGIPGTFSLPPRVSDPDIHHGTCVTYVLWCIPWSLTSGFFWIRWRRKRSQYSRRKHNPQFCVSGKRPMGPRWRHLVSRNWVDFRSGSGMFPGVNY